MTRALTTIKSHLLMYPARCDLAYPERAPEYLADAPVVDSLGDYTTQMWDILTDIVTWEWFKVRIPHTPIPWGSLVHLPPGMRMLNFLDRTHARKLQNDVQHQYLAHADSPRRMSMFSGYGLQVPHDFRREREGMEFLARQANYFKSHDHYVIIVREH